MTKTQSALQFKFHSKTLGRPAKKTKEGKNFNSVGRNSKKVYDHMDDLAPYEPTTSPKKVYTLCS